MKKKNNTVDPKFKSGSCQLDEKNMNEIQK